MGAVATAVGVLAVGYTIGHDKRDEQINLTKARTAKFYGSFMDRKANGESYTGQEELTLTFIPRTDTPIEIVKAIASGEVLDQGNRPIKRTWEFTGYSVGEYLILTYFTSKEKTAPGTGVYYLKKSGTAFVGFWIGKEAITQQTVKGAYVLLESEAPVEQVEKLYPVLTNRCEFVSFDPRAQSGGMK